VLGVTLSLDLTMDKHVSNVCSAGFYQLRQLRRGWRSLDTESAATLVHAFVTSGIDYCNVLLAGTPMATTDKLYSVFWVLQHVFSVARGSLIVDCPRLCMSTLIGSMFRSEWSTKSWRWCITVSMARLLRTWPTAALLSQTLPHGVVCVLPVVVNYSSLDTLISPHMVVTRRAFSVAGSAAWNCLSDQLREPLTANSFRQLLKTRLFAEY